MSDVSQKDFSMYGMHNLFVSIIQSLTCFVVMNNNDVVAFLTDRVTYDGLPHSDYTLRDLTKETLVRVVARYFEESNPDRYNTGDLVNLEPLTASSLFQKYYGDDCLSPGNFIKAMNEIIEGNLDIDRNWNNTSDWHFNAEQIHQGNNRMISLRTTILASLNNDSPDYAGIRDNIGKYLHLLQDFYSNTNWVELYPDSLNVDLGIRQLNDPVADIVQDAPCRNCRQILIEGRPELHDCVSALNYNRKSTYLYSGYRSGQDISKPEGKSISWGKCSHGGKFDSTWTKVATGGINKESSDPAISPHYHLHQTAAMLAIQAGEAFFNDEENGIRALIDGVKFQELLNLNYGGSFAFVIDDTGSMADEIEASVNLARALISMLSQSCQTSKQCIISPFNDPIEKFSPLTNSNDLKVCADALDELYPHGGDDCPEYVFTGIELALQAMIYPGNVYVWTDAGAKDEAKKPSVEALANQKNIKINFFLTGECEEARRRKRSTNFDNPYIQLSSATGGTVYHTTNMDISSVSNVVIAETIASEVSIIRWGGDDTTGVSLVFPVDETVKDITVKVTGPSARTKTQFRNPSGSHISFASNAVEIIVDSTNLFIFHLPTSIRGNWTLLLPELPRGVLYQVEVTAKSFLDFLLQIYERGNGGYLVPIDGLPLAGSNVTFLIDITSPELLEYANKLILYDSNGQNVILGAPLTDISGRSSGIYTTNAVLPEQSFTVSIVGMDWSGNKVQRLHPIIVEVLGFTLAISNVNNTVGNLVAGETGSFQLDLGNSGAADSFDLDVMVTIKSSSVNDPVSASIEPPHINLQSGKETSGLVTLAADNGAKAGDSVLITVNMISRTSGERNYVSLSLTLSEKIEIVEVIEDDVIPPGCIIANIEAICTADMIRRDCTTHFWAMRVALEDNRAISEITVSDLEISNSNYTFVRSNAASIEVIYESNCCCPNMSVVVEDKAGNFDRCEMDLFVRANVEDVIFGQCVVDCDDANECQNGGLCIGGRCDCAPGFNEILCGNDIDDCATTPCLHGGTCRDGVNRYYCDCTDTGYEGFQCEHDINDCLKGSCKNGGKCIDELKGFHCDCDDTGFEGSVCESNIDDCLDSPCQNDGTCIDRIKAFECNCRGTGFFGNKCQLDITKHPVWDNCYSAACKNGGKCINDYGWFRCFCIGTGYGGTRCEEDINECAAGVCLNDGACSNLEGSYTCHCTSGWKGENCEININECELEEPCIYNATCEDTLGTYRCVCPAGYHGYFCNEEIDECMSYPCSNGGICLDKLDQYECICHNGYHGDQCQLGVNQCANSFRCHSQATCYNRNGSFECKCNDGLQGDGLDICFESSGSSRSRCITMGSFLYFLVIVLTPIVVVFS